MCQMNEADQKLAMESIDRLFKDDFEPAWLVRQKRSKLEQLDEDLTASTALRWKQEAYEKMRRLSRRFPSKRAQRNQA
jgi:hypothetical protein